MKKLFSEVAKFGEYGGWGYSLSTSLGIVFMTSSPVCGESFFCDGDVWIWILICDKWQKYEDEISYVLILKHPISSSGRNSCKWYLLTTFFWKLILIVICLIRSLPVFIWYQNTMSSSSLFRLIQTIFVLQTIKISNFQSFKSIYTITSDVRTCFFLYSKLDT